MRARPPRPILSLLLGLGACGGDPAASEQADPDVTPTADGSAETASPDTQGSGRPRIPPNVLVVLADDIGVDKIGAYGEHPLPVPTPSIDALAASGVLFRNAWAYPSCSPTRAALLTGRYGRRTGVGDVVDAYDGTYELPAREITIPEMLALAQDPWTSGVVGKWHLATWGSESNIRHPGVQGFPWYRTNLSNIEQSSIEKTETYSDWELDDNGVLSWQTTYLTTFQVDAALERMATVPEPWFLYLALTAAHTPLHEPPRELYTLPTPGDVQAQRYHAVAEAMDTELGRLFAAVDLTDTVVVFMGDNGTPDHAVLAPRDPAASKLTLLEGGVNVPLVVAGPLVAAPGESAALVHAVDVFATVADVAGVDLAAVRADDGVAVPVDGRSLRPFLEDPGSAGRSVVYTEKFSPLGFRDLKVDQRAVRDARYKLMVDEKTGEEALFDLAGRPDDGPDLLGTGPLPAEAAAAYASLTAALDAFRSDLVPPSGSAAPVPE